LEIKFAKIHNQRYAVTANSGTSTLHMALNAFGVGHGDEVIIPGLTVAMCGYAVWQCGAVPVFADIKKDTFLIDPEDIQRKITKKTKAIMVVHLYGLMCNMTEIMKIAKKNKFFSEFLPTYSIFFSIKFTRKSVIAMSIFFWNKLIYQNITFT